MRDSHNRRTVTPYANSCKDELKYSSNMILCDKMHVAGDDMKMQTKQPKSLRRRRRKCKKMAQCVCCNFVSIPRRVANREWK